jgi:hypothetical protein
LFVVLVVMAPSSQELEPPANPGRFSIARSILWIERALLVTNRMRDERQEIS